MSAAVPTPTTVAVERALRGRRADWRGVVFQGALLATLLIVLVILIVLIGNVIRTGLPVFQARGADFLRSDLSSFAFRAGVWQGIVGSVSLMIFVVVIAFPLGIGAAVYIEEYARDTDSRGSSTRTSATWPACRRSCTDCSGSRSS